MSAASSVKHCRMRFSFRALCFAQEFERMLNGFRLPASIAYEEVKEPTWFVNTDSRCLAHAAELYQFIYRNGGRA